MSKQAELIQEIQVIVMSILKNGTVTEEEGIAIDRLEEELHKQNAFKKKSEDDVFTQGEEVATHFFNNEFEQGLEKLLEYKITPADFFSFIEYYYDEEHPDEDKIEMFTQGFIQKLNEAYKAKV